MCNEIMSKWKWIAKWCRELGFNELSKIADEIENTLRALYGNTVTDGWIERFSIYEEEMKRLHEVGNVVDALKLIRYVARSISGCVACLEDKYCDVCRFAIEYGAKCGEYGNPHHKFITKLDELINALEIENEILENDE